jgi:hypothetical protein
VVQIDGAVKARDLYGSLTSGLVRTVRSESDSDRERRSELHSTQCGLARTYEKHIVYVHDQEAHAHR